MTDLVGAQAIADELSVLAGIEVSTKQVYRLAEQERGPIERDRETWTISADGKDLAAWWRTSNFPKTFGNRLRNAAMGRHRGVMNGLRVIGVVGEGDLESSAFLDAIAQETENPINVMVNSNGGFVLDGLAIYHALRMHESQINVEIIGVAASMASAIAMAGDTVSMAEDGLMMLHDPWAGAVGNAEDLRAAAEMLDKHGESLSGIYARKTGMDEDSIREMMAKNGGDGTWLNAEEALDMGFIDEILAPAEARLPKIPAAALAKRLTKGGAPMKRKTTGLVKEINDLLAKLATDDKPREDLVKDLAAKAEIEADAVEKILSGEAEPTLAQLTAFAEVLNEDEGEDEANPKRAAAKAQAVDVAAAVRDELNAERKRQKSIRAEVLKHGLDDVAAREISEQAEDIADARAMIIKKLSEGSVAINGNHRVTVTEDERDKWLEGATNWLLVKSGNARLIEAHTKKRPEPGEFRGLRMIDLARDSLERQGVNLRGKNPKEIAKMAIRADAGLGSRSDFPLLLENVLHKMLQAAYETAPDQWRQIASTGSVQDFRDHPRYRLGSLSRLDTLDENGEFKTKHFPDAEKEVISAGTFGNLIGMTRQAIVNDDLDGFSRMVVMLGRAAARSIEIDLFALFGLNSGLGPTMRDGNPMFDASHSNIASTGGTPGTATLEAARVLMAQQKDPDDNDFLNLRPDVWVGPIGLGSNVRSAISAEFDFDAGGSNPKFMKPNTVRDLLSTVVDTPRLSGDRWYVLADPSVAPVFEVVFLDGEESPVIETEEGFGYDGVRWKIRHDYGVGATDFRGAVTNAGT